jgi:hypothetical protein
MLDFHRTRWPNRFDDQPDWRVHPTCREVVHERASCFETVLPERPSAGIVE